MLHEDRLLKTMSAVKGCLAECLRTPAPLATLDNYVQGLRRSPQWDDKEVAEVEATARRALEAAKRSAPPSVR
jgi:hypothetical protein